MEDLPKLKKTPPGANIYIGGGMEKPVQEKKQQSAIAHWEDLKPRVEQARRDRDLDPIQKSDQEFWNIRKRAIEQYRPPSAPGMPVQEQQNTSRPQPPNPAVFCLSGLLTEHARQDQALGITATGSGWRRFHRLPRHAFEETP